jgi:uncharacterized repeat protein (TIGR01451 family)
MISRSLKRGFLLATAVTFSLNGTLHAAGTVAGTSITNTATVNYSVGGSAQSPVTSNTASFLVDRKVNLSVTEVGGAATSVSYGDNGQVTTFQVTNLTNATQDFRLFASQQLSLAITTFGLTDNMDMNNVHVYVDANGNGTYEPLVDTASYIDELAPDLSKTVFIVADTPSSGGSSGTAGVALTARTAVGGTPGALGSDIAATVGVDSPTTIDVVFADAAGAIDLLHDGAQSALDSYVTATTSVTFAKSAVIISDPVNLTLAPKAIPGAVVEYCLRVSNTGGSSATLISISDAIPTNTTYVANSLYVGGTTLLGECVIDGTPEDDNATGADEIDLNGGSSDGTTVLATMPLILPGTTATARFRVTLN